MAGIGNEIGAQRIDALELGKALERDHQLSLVIAQPISSRPAQGRHHDLVPGLAGQGLVDFDGVENAMAHGMINRADQFRIAQ